MKFRFLALSSFLLLVGCGPSTNTNKVRDIEEPTSTTAFKPIDVKKEGYGLDKELLGQLTQTDGQGMKVDFDQKAVKEIKAERFRYMMEFNNFESATEHFHYGSILESRKYTYYKDTFEIEEINDISEGEDTNEVSDAYLNSGLKLEFDKNYRIKEISKNVEDVEGLKYIYRDDYGAWNGFTETYDLHQQYWYIYDYFNPRAEIIQSELRGLTDGFYSFTSQTKNGYVLISQTTKHESQGYLDDIVTEFEELEQNILFFDKEYNVYKGVHYYDRIANYVDWLDVNDLFEEMIPVKREVKIFDIIYGEEEEYADRDEYLEAIPDTVNGRLEIYGSYDATCFSEDGSRIEWTPRFYDDDITLLNSNDYISQEGVDGRNIVFIKKMNSNVVIKLDRMDLYVSNIKNTPHGEYKKTTNKYAFSEEFAKALLEAMGAFTVTYQGETYYVITPSSSKFVSISYPYSGNFTLDDLVIESIDSI